MRLENMLRRSQLKRAAHSVVVMQRRKTRLVVTHVPQWLGLELTLWLLKKPDGCSCKEAGWCPRWNKSVTRNTFQLCKNREDYRRAWERQRSPKELGDVVRDVLHWMGFKHTKNCRCTNRQRLINRWWRYWLKIAKNELEGVRWR